MHQICLRDKANNYEKTEVIPRTNKLLAHFTLVWFPQSHQNEYHQRKSSLHYLHP